MQAQTQSILLVAASAALKGGILADHIGAAYENHNWEDSPVARIQGGKHLPKMRADTLGELLTLGFRWTPSHAFSSEYADGIKARIQAARRA